MAKVILGRKVGMTQIFTSDGRLEGVTVIQTDGCCVVQKKMKSKDGYDSVQLGYGDVFIRNVNQPMLGHFNRAGVLPKRHLREYRLEEWDVNSFSMGDPVTADVFVQGDRVDVVGISKGHGFSGTVKRWKTHRGPMSHGSGYHRGVGSMGSSAHPARVFKGKKLPGRYGNDRVTIQNLTITRVSGDLILIKGAVPGPKNGLIVVKEAVKFKKANEKG